MFDFGGAYADGERAECAVRGGVAVAAHYDLSGLGEALLGANDVDDALVGAEPVVEGHTELVAVALEIVELLYGNGVVQGTAEFPGGGVVVHGGYGEVWPADFAAGHTQSLERLR